MCVCVCVRTILGKLRTLVAPMSYWQTSNYTRIKNDKRHLLKPFGYNVITVFITHGYCFQTWEDSWGHLNTSKHNYSCIMAIASKALHQSKQYWVSGCYNIEHWLKHSPWKSLSSSVHFKFSTWLPAFVFSWVLRTSFCRTFHKTHWRIFLSCWDKTETKM